METTNFNDETKKCMDACEQALEKKIKDVCGEMINGLATTKEQKAVKPRELSIENIKKDIIDKLMNNMEILKYLEAERRVAEGTRLEQFFNRFIFDHDTTYAGGNYISVEVSEFDTPYSEKYVVTIKMGLEREENVCPLASVVAGIIDKLYPNKEKFSNAPFRTVDNCLSVNDYGYSANYPTFNTVSLENRRQTQLHRMITFELE